MKKVQQIHVERIKKTLPNTTYHEFCKYYTGARFLTHLHTQQNIRTLSKRQ